MSAHTGTRIKRPNVSIILFSILVALLTVSCTRPSRLLTNWSTSATESIHQEISVDGSTRGFRLYVPKSLAVDRQPPLVLNFHGLGATASQQERLSGMSAVAEREGFIAAYPQGLNNAWHAGAGPDAQADLAYVRALIMELSRQHGVDPSRVYATGISNGGGMANRLACEMAGEIAAIATVAGAYSRWWDCSPSRPIAVLSFHGREDRIVPYEGSEHGRFVPPIPEWAAAWAARNGCEDGAKVSEPAPGVRREEWSGCEGGAAVVLFALEGHGHSWPGSDAVSRGTSQAVDATELMWEFFEGRSLDLTP